MQSKIYLPSRIERYKLPAMFYFAKSLQAAAMAVTALALFVGFYENSMTKELTMLGIGVVLFVVGRLVERYGT